MPYRVAIIDDNKLLRENLVNRLSGKLELVYEGSSATAFIKFMAGVSSNQWPQLVLMDIEMDEMDGIAATAQLKQKYPLLRIAMLTVFEQDEKVWQSILAGADGYILKDETRDRILGAIEDIMQGGAYMSPAIAVRAMRLLRQQPPARVVAGMVEEQLTRRELEILEMIAQGFSYKQIAEKSFISIYTAKTHIHHIYEKLQVRNKMDAAKLYVSQKIR
ncbi:MAG: response regulator transcription factor [Chitinophagaceae bacterium]|jgi:DNA-binding NarL/FixJ family response regulator|nr:response regulator transcription factor [Chitinophagaceae bacterium]